MYKVLYRREHCLWWCSSCWRKRKNLRKEKTIL